MGDLQHSKLLVVNANGRFPTLQTDGVFQLQRATLAVSANEGILFIQNFVNQIFREDGFLLNLGNHPVG